MARFLVYRTSFYQSGWNVALKSGLSTLVHQRYYLSPQLVRYLIVASDYA